MNDKQRLQFIDASERTCSALALNCCQFSCCLPSHNILVRLTAPSSADNWMERLMEKDDGVKLRDLVLPGTHDSGSYSISGLKLFSAVGRTQCLDITRQLQSGARYLDLRFAGASADANQLSIWHGCLEGGNIRAILAEIDGYLKNHRSEFVIVEMVPEFGRDLSSDQKDKLLTIIKHVFGDRIHPGSSFDDLMKSSLADIVKAGHQVAILLHSRFYENYNRDERSSVDDFGFCKSQTAMNNRWHNTRVVDDLLKANLEEVQKRGDDRKTLLNSQFILTPGVGGPSDILAALTGQNSLQPIRMASLLYKPNVLDRFLREHADEKWNILMLDCIDRCPLVVEYALALNFGTKLQIKCAAVAFPGTKSLNVTEKARTCVGRDRVLLLTNVQADLGLPVAEGTLTVAYQLGEECEVVTIVYDAYSQVIISAFVTGEFEHKVALTGRASGTIVGGQLQATRSADAGPVLEYKATDDGFKFNVME